MRPSEILSHLRRQPFEPIRIFLTDGATYDVRHPELALVSLHTVVIGLEPLRDDMPQRLAYCDPIHVVRIEPLNGRKPRRAARR